MATVDVIGEPIKPATEINAAKPPGNMTEDEYAFCPALAEDESAVRNPGIQPSRH